MNMNDEHNNPTPPNPPTPDMNAGLNADDLSVAAMLRACADGELCSEECDRLKRYLKEHPEAAGQVEFEKVLKGSCDRVMRSSSVCPDSLRGKIEAMVCACATASNIEASNATTRQKNFWQRSPIMSAVAAVLVLAGGALIWQSASIITKGSGLGFVQTTPVAYAERVGNFVAREHMRCCDDKAAAKKLIHDEIEESIAYFSERFATPVTTPASSTYDAQIRYYGGGDCSVPATEKSGHMRFDAVGSDEQPVSLSLFIAPDPELLGLEEGVTYLLNSTECSELGANLFAWVSDGVMYLLVSEADENMCADVRSMMRAPGELRRL